MHDCIAIFNFVPTHCPGCGESLTGPNLAGPDWMEGNVRGCKACGLLFALAKDEHLMEAASKSGSDLERYAR